MQRRVVRRAGWCVAVLSFGWVIVWGLRLTPLFLPPVSTAQGTPGAPAKRSLSAISQRCRKQSSHTIRGNFRELSCLISARRSIPAAQHPLDTVLQRRFHKVYQRLRRSKVDRRTIAQWQTLYILGTRLYPLKNRQAETAALPVYEVNGHHKAVPFWIKEGLRRKVGPLLHIDTHSDMHMIFRPQDVRKAVRDLKSNRNPRRAWHTIAHSIDNCAMPVSGAVLSGFYNEIIWLKPSWNPLPSFLQQQFFYGEKRQLSCSQAKPLGKRGPYQTPQPQMFQLYYDHRDNPSTPPLPPAGLWANVGPELRPKRSHFRRHTPFTFSVITANTTDGVETFNPAFPSGPTSVSQVSYLRQLLQAIPAGGFTLDLDLDYFASIDYSKEFQRRAIRRPRWWEWRRFQKQRKLLKARLQEFKTMLAFLKKHKRVPSVITIADSTFLNFAFDKVAEGQSEYTPIQHSAYLRAEVRKILYAIYGDKILPRSAKGHLTLAQPSPSTPSKPPATSPPPKTYTPLSKTKGKTKTLQ